jgi:hypothetical protein
MTRIAGIVAVFLYAGVANGKQPPDGLSNWAFDEITHVNGNKFQGLITANEPDLIRFISVQQTPGRPTVCIRCRFAKSELKEIKKLSEDERKILRERVDWLLHRRESERLQMESLEIVAIPWLGKPGTGKSYESEYFLLESDGSEELTRRCAVRLEQIYAAFRPFLHPSTTDFRPTKIQLAMDRDDYKALLGPLGGEKLLLNPAVYDPRSNSIVCWSDLKRLGNELQTARLHHSQQLAALKQYEERVSKLYKNDELAKYLKPIDMERNRVWTADNDNGKKFDEAAKRLFAILYHEAFHAYVGTFVYPPLKAEDVRAGKGTGELPRWLNEGLAQVFETAIVEAGEMRVDSPDRDRLLRVKDWLKGKGGDRLVTLSELLSNGKESFLASHTDQKAASNRAYLASWALAYYLTFDLRVIGTADFKRYLITVNSGSDPKEAFATLVGKDLNAFEKDWHTYLLRLQSDGTMTR